jgi:hypothetical protein
MSAGFQWSAWAYAEVSGVDVNATSLATGTALTCDAIDLDGKAACEVGITSAEPNNLAPDTSRRVHLLALREAGDDYMTVTDAIPSQLLSFIQVQNGSCRGSAAIDCAKMRNVKLAVNNECLRTVNITLRYRTATFGDPPT